MFYYIKRIRQEATPQRLKQLWYAPTLVLAMALTMLRMLVMARILSVEEFAVFSNGILVSGSFCMIGCFGLQTLLQRNWPVMLVRGQEYRGLILAAQANLVAIGCAFIGFMLVGAGFSVAGLSAPVLYVGLLHGLSQQFFMIASIESRSRGRPVQFANQNFVRAIAIFCLGAAVGFMTHSALKALATEGSISFVLSVIFFQKSADYTPSGQLTIYRLAMRRFNKIHWNAALIMMAVSTVNFLQSNIDRWIASDRLDAVMFARYSFACIVLTIGQSAQMIINSTLFPFIARRYAQVGHVAAFKISAAISAVVFIFGIIVIVPGGYILNYAIDRWYPSYSDAAVLLPIFLIVAVLRLSDFWSSFLVIVHRQNLLFVLNTAITALVAGGFFIYVEFLSNRGITIMDIGIMAAVLSLTNYIGAAVASGLVGRKAC